MAYRAWGVECVQHLRGDFAFAIWDDATKTLFCARDHFGIKPLYYSHSERIFVFSNVLNCLRLHPNVTSELNESAIGDFLLFGSNYNLGTTTFRDVQRLPPAHLLLVTENTLQTRRYWSPPTDGNVRYPRPDEYVEHFLELMRAAVSDRMATGSTGIWLSGGLDSGTVAAIATESVKDSVGSAAIRSYTFGYDRLIPDEEGTRARAVAGHLGIPNRYRAMDNCELFEHWDDPKFRFPVPVDDPLAASSFEHFAMTAAECSVFFSGEGADNLLYFQMLPHLRELRRARQWRRLVVDALAFAAVRPFPWRGAISRARSVFKRLSGGPSLPKWIAKDFARRMGLVDRLNRLDSLTFPPTRHPTRPKGHASLLLPEWANLFEMTSPGVTGHPVEVRYPFLDLRVVEYLLAIPTFPWAYKKTILRRAMVGRLPNTALNRKKTPLQGIPALEKLNATPDRLPPRSEFTGIVCDFVSSSSLPDYATMTVEDFRPYCLHMWLKGID
jgi:asparagine synthase (glutamine-hydrolysing)